MVHDRPVQPQQRPAQARERPGQPQQRPAPTRERAAHRSDGGAQQGTRPPDGGGTPGNRPPPVPDDARRERGRPWRERLPELVALIGAGLVALAITGFLSSTWEAFSDVQKASVLGAAAAALTAAGLFADRDRANRFEFVVGVFWSTATLLVAAAVTLASAATWPGIGRITIGAGGVAALAHAAVLWRRRPQSVAQQVATLGAALYAIGPFGTALADRFTWDQVLLLGKPVWGLTDPSVTSDAFLITGIAHLTVGALWLGLARLLPSRAARTAQVLGTVVLGFAALELNVLTSPVGAVLALAVVLGYLLYGLVTDDAALTVTGVVGTLIAGIRVLVALFSGQMLVTVLVFTGGLGMLAWAFAQMRRRQQRTG